MGVNIPCLENPTIPSRKKYTPARSTGRLTLRVPPLRRISYMTPMMMPSGTR